MSHVLEAMSNGHGLLVFIHIKMFTDVQPHKDKVNQVSVTRQTGARLQAPVT